MKNEIINTIVHHLDKGHSVTLVANHRGWLNDFKEEIWRRVTDAESTNVAKAGWYFNRLGITLANGDEVFLQCAFPTVSGAAMLHTEVLVLQDVSNWQDCGGLKGDQILAEMMHVPAPTEKSDGKIFIYTIDNEGELKSTGDGISETFHLKQVEEPDDRDDDKKLWGPTYQLPMMVEAMRGPYTEAGEWRAGLTKKGFKGWLNHVRAGLVTREFVEENYLPVSTTFDQCEAEVLMDDLQALIDRAKPEDRMAIIDSFSTMADRLENPFDDVPAQPQPKVWCVENYDAYQDSQVVGIFKTQGWSELACKRLKQSCAEDEDYRVLELPKNEAEARMRKSDDTFDEMFSYSADRSKYEAVIFKPLKADDIIDAMVHTAKQVGQVSPLFVSPKTLAALSDYFDDKDKDVTLDSEGALRKEGVILATGILPADVLNDVKNINRTAVEIESRIAEVARESRFIDYDAYKNGEPGARVMLDTEYHATPEDYARAGVTLKKRFNDSINSIENAWRVPVVSSEVAVAKITKDSVPAPKFVTAKPDAPRMPDIDMDKPVCRCLIMDLMSHGHNDGCPEKKK